MTISNFLITVTVCVSYLVIQIVADKDGGVTYTRWGRTTCPNSTGATLVYEGYAAGSHWQESGGGANYLCLPKIPEYWSIGVGQSTVHAFLYGAEYHSHLYPSFYDSTPPCAVCFAVGKTAALMIPAKLTCPPSWTMEYNGYLVAEHYTNSNNVVFECVDFNREAVPGTSKSDPSASFHHVRTKCHGLPCPPYSATKELSCVVCTK